MLADAAAADVEDDGIRLAEGGTGGTAYADAVTTYLAFAISKLANTHSSLSRWRPDAGKEGLGEVFSRQAISMVWDFAEGNPWQPGPADIASATEWIAKAVALLPVGSGVARQADAAVAAEPGAVICTDPPYYDNVGYADLSDSSTYGSAAPCSTCTRGCSARS